MSTEVKVKAESLAMLLHVPMSNAISHWGMQQAKSGLVLPGKDLTWITAAAMGLEMLVMAKASGQPIMHILNITREVVTRFDAIKYANDVVERSLNSSGGIISG